MFPGRRVLACPATKIPENIAILRGVVKLTYLAIAGMSNLSSLAGRIDNSQNTSIDSF